MAFNQNRNTINGSIDKIIEKRLKQERVIEEITIHKICDESHVDVKTKNDEILTYIPCIANNLAVGHHGLLIPLEENRFYVVSK